MSTVLYLPLAKCRLCFPIIAVWLLLSTCVGFSQASPFLPSSADEVLERLPNSRNENDRELRQLQQQLGAEPQNLELATRIAGRFIEKARADADPRYYGYAQAAVAYWWNQTEPPPEVLMIRATLRQHRHDFDGALADLQDILAMEPRNAQAWLSQAVILSVRGHHEQSLNSCLVLKRLTSRLVAATCAGNTAGLSGKARQAYQFLKESLASAAENETQERLWALTLLAEIAERLGDVQSAEEHFTAALALKQRDVYLLSAYCDFLLDRHRPNEVIAMLKDDTRPDGLLLRLALAEQQIGAPTLAQHMNDIQARIFAYRLRGDTIHQREEARYYLHLLNKPKDALDLALLNWGVQREPWDARLVLEAALAAKDFNAAKPVLDWLAQSKLEDSRLQELLAKWEQH